MNLNLDQTGITYVVKSKKDGNETTVKLSSLSEVSDYIEKNSDVIGVWNVTIVKLPEGVYTRRKNEKHK